MHFARSLVIAALGLILLSRTSGAQTKGAFEMGYDLGLAFQVHDSKQGSFADGDVNSLDLPASTLRLGYFLEPHSELETRLGFASVSGSGPSVFDLAFGLDYARHFGDGSHHPYVRAGGRYSLRGSDQFDDMSQFGLDLGLGAKNGIGHQLATRFDFGMARYFESDRLAGHWDFSISFGISFFTR